MTLSQEIIIIKAKLELTQTLYQMNRLALEYLTHLEDLSERSKKPVRITTLSQLCAPQPGELNRVDRRQYIEGSNKYLCRINLRDLSDVDCAKVNIDFYAQLVDYRAGKVPIFSDKENVYLRSNIDNNLSQLTEEYNQLKRLLQEKQEAQQAAQEEELISRVTTELEMGELEERLRTLQAEFSRHEINHEEFAEEMMAFLGDVRLVMGAFEPGNPNLPDWLERVVVELAELEDAPQEDFVEELQVQTQLTSLESGESLASSSSSHASLDTVIDDSRSSSPDTSSKSHNIGFVYDFFKKESTTSSSRRPRVFFEI